MKSSFSLLTIFAITCCIEIKAGEEVSLVLRQMAAVFAYNASLQALISVPTSSTFHGDRTSPLLPVKLRVDQALVANMGTCAANYAWLESDDYEKKWFGARHFGSDIIAAIRSAAKYFSEYVHRTSQPAALERIVLRYHNFNSDSDSDSDSDDDSDSDFDSDDEL